MKVPRDYQEAANIALWNYLHENPGKNPLVVEACHAAGHPILMFDGSVKPVEEVAVGDLLMGPDSKPKRVLELCRGRQEMRRIIPVKGESFVVNKDHILHLRRSPKKAGAPEGSYARGGFVNIPVGELEDKSNWYRHRHKLVTTGVEFNKKSLPLQPYFLGALLGDGFLSGTPSFTSQENEVMEFMISEAVKIGCTPIKAGEISYYFGCVSSTRSVQNPLTKELRNLGLWEGRSSSHFIPKEYLTSSKEDRLQILAGLIDTDGYYHASGGGYDFDTISKQLANDVLFLCRSLGFGAYLKKGRAKLNGKIISDRYRVTFSGIGLEEIPCKIEYKKASTRKQVKNVNYTGFKIEKLPEEDYYGFTLPGDHLYVDGNFVVHHNTGLGKSLNIAMIIRMLLYYYPQTRIMQTCHVKELVNGNYEELMAFWPSAPAGLYSAGLGVRDLRKQITFAGIASVAKRAHAFQHIDFLIVDEAHAINDKESTTYAKFIQELRKVNPRLIVIGFTATPFRMTTGMLTDGQLFDEVAYDIGSGESFVWAVEQGYLVRPVPKNPGFELDSSSIGVQSGDFKNKETSDALHDQDILERAVDTTIALGVDQGRKNWLSFCQSIDDAETVADMFTYKGYPHAAVHSKRIDREEVLAKWTEGKLVGVTNKDILTTGFNNPRIDLITMLRLTRSPGLWIQMIGRGTRPSWVPGYDLSTLEGRKNSILASDKQTCLVLDFVGNTKRLGPINYPNLPKRRGSGGGSDPVRECPSCLTYVHISLKTCPECEYEFPPPERVTPGASEDAIVDSRALDLSQQPPPKEFEIFSVHKMICAQHTGKNGKPDTMRVDYFCGYRRFSCWICLGHDEGSFPRRKAKEWWSQHGGGEPPASVEDGVEQAGDLTKPKFIKVWINTKYPEIVAYDFKGIRFELPPELGGPPLQEPEPDPLATVQEQQRKAQEHADATASPMYFDDDIPF